MNIEQIAKEALLEIAPATECIADAVEATEFLRRCLAKLAAQQDAEPAAFMKSLPATNFFRTHEAHTYFTTNPDLDGLDNEGWTKLFTEAQLIVAQQKVVESAAHFSERMKLLCDNAILAAAGKIDASSEARNELFAYIDYVQSAFDSPFISPDISECQQRTAEACAKVCKKVQRDNCGEKYDMMGKDLAEQSAEAIRNGEWREYL